MSGWGGRKVARLRRVVLAAYGPVCYLNGPYCREHGRAIDLSLRFPHRGSFTIEHTDPRSAGGADHLALLRPAHLACNSSRGNGTSPRPSGRPRRTPETGARFSEQGHGKPRSPLPSPPEPTTKNGQTVENAEG